MRGAFTWTFRMLLVFGAAVGSAEGQSITTSVSPSGSMVLTHITVLTPGCYQPQTTTVNRSGSQFAISTIYVQVTCISPPPAGVPPVVATVDLGFLSAGQYQVSWATLLPPSGPSLPPTTATFVIPRDQTAAAVPALNVVLIGVLALTLAALGAVSRRVRRSGPG